MHEACSRFELDPLAYSYDELTEIKIIGSSTISGTGKVDWNQHVTPDRNFKLNGHWENGLHPKSELSSGLPVMS